MGFFPENADNRHTLAKLNRIATQLAKIENIDEAKSLRDKAEALRIYAKQQQASEEIERQIVIVWLRTERRIGELLEKPVSAGNPQLSNRATIVLSDVGISRISRHGGKPHRDCRSANLSSLWRLHQSGSSALTASSS